MRFASALLALCLAGCGTYVNRARPDANYYADHQACMDEIGLFVIGKHYGERLNDCVAAKGWVIE